MFKYINELNNQIFIYINQGMSNKIFDIVMPILRDLYTWIPLYLIFVVWVVIKFGYRAWIIILSIAILVGVTDFGASSIIKPYFEVLRPCNDPFWENNINLLVPCNSNYSFISAHASNHFGLAMYVITLFSLYKKNRIACYGLLIWAIIIIFAQVYVGVHYPLDVLLGAFYGSLVGTFIGRITKNALNE